MSSLHNDLDTWANKSIAQGNDRIEILNSTAHEIAETLREHQQLRDAMFKPQSASDHYEGDGGIVAELLAALKLAKDHSELEDEVLDIVNAAISKAEGGEA